MLSRAKKNVEVEPKKRLNVYKDVRKIARHAVGAISVAVEV